MHVMRHMSCKRQNVTSTLRARIKPRFVIRECVNLRQEPTRHTRQPQGHPVVTIVSTERGHSSEHRRPNSRCLVTGPCVCLLFFAACRIYVVKCPSPQNQRIVYQVYVSGLYRVTRAVHVPQAMGHKCLWLFKHSNIQSFNRSSRPSARTAASQTSHLRAPIRCSALKSKDGLSPCL